jgi:hypothetical protein
MPPARQIPCGVYCRKGKEHNMTEQVVADEISLIQRRELVSARNALTAISALRDAVSLKRKTHIPLMPATRDAIRDLASQINGLRLESLPNPDQLELPLNQ